MAVEDDWEQTATTSDEIWKLAYEETILSVMNTVLKSVATMRLVKTENASVCVCVTVNCKVCRSAIALC
jgi:hypothetical protein